MSSFSESGTLSEYPLDNIRHELSGVRDPVATDDITSGFNNGSLWININDRNVFMCLTGVKSHAVWASILNASATIVDPDVPEIITASNIGGGGAPIFKDKNVSNLEFRSLSSTSTIAAVLNGDTIQLSLNETLLANINTHLSNYNNPHYTTKAQVGLSNVQNILMNYQGQGPPTILNDGTQGYSVGSQWLDLVNGGNMYVCVNNATNMGIWKQINNPVSVKNTFNATTVPTFGNDLSQGYMVGSEWVNTATSNVYICTNNSYQNATWKVLSTQTITPGQVTALSNITTSGDTLATLLSIATTIGQAYFLQMSIIGRRTDVSPMQCCAYNIQCLYKNDGGFVTKVDDDSLTIEDNNLWRIVTNLCGMNILVSVRPSTFVTITWRVSYTLLSI
jgi:hypothetical protein